MYLQDLNTIENVISFYMQVARDKRNKDKVMHKVGKVFRDIKPIQNNMEVIKSQSTDQIRLHKRKVQTEAEAA